MRWTGRNAGLGQVGNVSLEGKGLGSVGRIHEPDELVQCGLGVIQFCFEAVEFKRLVTAADTEPQPIATEARNHADVFEQAHRLIERHHDNGGA